MKMWIFGLNMGIFQPAMLVYHKGHVQISPLGESVEMVLFDLALGSFESWRTVTETKFFFKIHAPPPDFPVCG